MPLLSPPPPPPKLALLLLSHSQALTLSSEILNKRSEPLRLACGRIVCSPADYWRSRATESWIIIRATQLNDDGCERSLSLSARLSASSLLLASRALGQNGSELGFSSHFRGPTERRMLAQCPPSSLAGLCHTLVLYCAWATLWAEWPGKVKRTWRKLHITYWKSSFLWRESGSIAGALAARPSLFRSLVLDAPDLVASFGQSGARYLACSRRRRSHHHSPLSYKRWRRILEMRLYLIVSSKA